MFVLSSAALTAVNLNFAVGTYSWDIYIGYFTHPLVFLLNWIPVLLLQALLMAALNRQWAAFLTTSVLTALPSIGNFFKIRFRNEPFAATDLPQLSAGLAVAGKYDIGFNSRIIAAILLVVLGTLFLLFFARGRLDRRARLVSALAVLLSLFPLWKLVYSSAAFYDRVAEQNYVPTTWDTREKYIDTGFFYPFLHSITEITELPPNGYSEAAAEELYEGFASAVIPEEKKVNLMILQLESFCDLEEMGVSDIPEEVYAPLRQLREECVSGRLIPNVIGGGTIDTERCVLTGSIDMLEYRHPAYSYVRYLTDQGYFACGAHPYVHFFYSRMNVMDYLGFERFYFSDDYFTQVTPAVWGNDDIFLPEVFRLFREDMRAGHPVFAFNITTQGHSPYNTEIYPEYEELIGEGKLSAPVREELNIYLTEVKETQQLLVNELDTLRESPEPTVLLIYGDHKPRFEDAVYRELGIQAGTATEKGMVRYLATPYLIWANDAAKKALNMPFTGEGPTVSPGYLMNILFDSLGWEAPAFMKFTNFAMERVPVHSAMGAYLENGSYSSAPGAETAVILQQYRFLQYYLHYRPDLVR